MDKAPGWASSGTPSLPAIATVDGLITLGGATHKTYQRAIVDPTLCGPARPS